MTNLPSSHLSLGHLKRASLSAGVSTMALVFSPSAIGQEQAVSTELRKLDAITVTAQRREETANSVPMGIQAFSGEQLEKLRLNSVEDLELVVPGFSVTPTPQGVPNYYLRGIGFNTINQSSASTVGTYVDEVAYPYPIMNAGPVYDMERIEVLKGPQGTLFGRNTTAGLINFVTAKPSDEFAANVQGEVGNYDTTNLEGMINGGLADIIQARASFRVEKSEEGWQKSMSRGEDLGKVRRYGARLGLAIQPTSSLDVDFSYNYWLNQSDTQAAQMIAYAPPVDPAFGGAYAPFNEPGLIDFFDNNKPSSNEDADWAPFIERSTDLGEPGVGYGPGLKNPLAEDTDFHGLKLNLNYDFGNGVSLASLTGYNKLEREATTDFSGAPFELLLNQVEGEIESISQEFRLEGQTNRAEWLVGAYYGKDDLFDTNVTQEGQNATVQAIRVITAQLLATPINTFGYTPDDVVNNFRTYRDRGYFETTTASVFANADWTLTDTLKLTTGVRYTEDEQAYRGCTSDYEGSLVPVVNIFNRTNWANLPSTDGPPEPIGINDCNSYIESENRFGFYESNLKEDNIAWRLAANWTPTADMLFYASASKGAKSATTPVNAATRAEQNAPATQEMLLAYEVGTKATLFNNSMQANGAVFYYDYEDKQSTANFPDPIYTVLSQLQNIDQSEAYGVDADITWRILPDLTLIGAGTWLHTEVTEWNDAYGTDGQLIDPSGRSFAFSPEFSGSLNLLYDNEISSTLGIAATLSGRYQGDSHAGSDSDPLYQIDAYGLLDASIGLYSLDGVWRFSLWGRNLTDEYYWSQVTSNSNAVVRFTGRPRTYGITLKRNF